MFAGCGKLTADDFAGRWLHNTENTKDEWVFHTGNVLERQTANTFVSSYMTGKYTYEDGTMVITFDDVPDQTYTYEVELKKNKTLKMTDANDTIEYTFQK